MTSPTQRSLAHLRSLGYRVAVVERWNPHARIRQDLFGVLDLLAVRDGEILGVQTTNASYSTNTAPLGGDHIDRLFTNGAGSFSGAQVGLYGVIGDVFASDAARLAAAQGQHNDLDGTLFDLPTPTFNAGYAINSNTSL